jgi:hypothetical protein
MYCCGCGNTACYLTLVRRMWTRSFQIIWYQEWCLYTPCMYIQTNKQTNYYWQLWLIVHTYFNTYYHYTIILQFYLLQHFKILIILLRISRTFWHIGLYTFIILTLWEWCHGVETCSRWYYDINGVSQSAFVGWFIDCTDMYSVNYVKIAEHLVVAVSRLVCNELSQSIHQNS